MPEFMVRLIMLHHSKFPRHAPLNDPPRIGVGGAVLTLVGGIVGLNLIAAFSPTLAIVLAGSVIVLAVSVYLFTLFRKD